VWLIAYRKPAAPSIAQNAGSAPGLIVHANNILPEEVVGYGGIEGQIQAALRSVQKGRNYGLDAAEASMTVGAYACPDLLASL
jgi:hypothetical protein